MKNFRRIPYNHRVAVVILFFTLLPCIVLEFIYLKNMQQNWMQSALVTYEHNVNSTASLSSQTLTGMYGKMQYILNSSSVRTSISQINKLSLVQSLDYMTALDDTANSITADNHSLVVRWYPHLSTKSYGNYSYTLDIFANEFPLGDQDPCYHDILALDGQQILWKIREISREANNAGLSETRLCLYTQMINLNGSNCILELSIPVSEILSSNDDLTVPNSLLGICLNQGLEPINIVLETSFASNDAELHLSEYQKKGELPGFDIICAPIPNITNSEVVMILPTSHTKELIRPQWITFILVSILIAILIVIASYLTSYLLTRHILNTIDTINHDLKTIIDEQPDTASKPDDIDYISICVKKLIQNTREYSAKLERYELENIRMELELLQMRFNPHLLYNTLGVIRHQLKNPQCRHSIDSLCQYYRIVLNNGHLFIKLKDEFEMVKEYLSIEKFSYRLDNIEFEFHIDEEIAKYTIIKHLLQPIVENALHHGIRKTGHGGHLSIIAFPEDNLICIQIIDDGIGMSSEEVAHLLTEPSANISSGGYGIYNVQQRIQVYYGKDYGLDIKSTIGAGTTVTLRIPAIPPRDEKSNLL